MNLTILLMLVTLGLCWIGTTESCSCYMKASEMTSDEELYCDADYAILARVLDDGRRRGEKRVHKIQIIHKYKSNIPWNRVKTNVVLTFFEIAMCGVILKRDSVVLLGGYFKDSGPRRRSRMHINQCNLFGYLRDPSFYTPPDCEEYSTDIALI